MFDKDWFNDFTTSVQYIQLELEPNTQYTLSSNIPTQSTNTDNANLFLMLQNESASSYSNGIKPNQPRTITTDSSGILKIGYRDFVNEYSDEKNKYWYMLNKGSSANEYEPYGMVWYKYSEIYASIGSKIGWRIGGNQPFNDTKLFYDTMKNVKGSTTNIISNFLSYSSNIYSANNIGMCVFSGSEIGVRVSTNTANDLASFTNWLDVNNVKIYYELANPTYTIITSPTLISQLEALQNQRSINGTNVITSECEEGLPVRIGVTALLKEVS